MTELSAPEWEDYLASFPDAHILQTRAWAELKSGFGWKATYLSASNTSASLGDMGAQILLRKLPLGLTIAYIAKGPVGSEATVANPAFWEALWPEVGSLCRKHKVVFLKIEPDLWETPVEVMQMSDERPDSPPHGLSPSLHSIQPRRTLVVDLRGDEEQVLTRMKQKTRYNIRLALRKGVSAYPSNDLDTFYRLMTVTGERDMFGVHSRQYYQRAYELFYPLGECVLLMAEFQGEPLSALMAFAHGKRAWYFYGASGNAHRELMPTYLLQWEAMRWARVRGCISYDLWGVPDCDEATLEANFAKRNDGLWGVYRFKRGFGGELLRAHGPWDRVYNPVLYTLYSWWLRRKSQESCT